MYHVIVLSGFLIETQGERHENTYGTHGTNNMYNEAKNLIQFIAFKTVLNGACAAEI